MSLSFLTNKHSLHGSADAMYFRLKNAGFASLSGIFTANDECLGLLEGGTMKIDVKPENEKVIRHVVADAIHKAMLTGIMRSLVSEASREVNNGFPVTQVVFHLNAEARLDCELKWLDERVERLLLGRLRRF